MDVAELIRLQKLDGLLVGRAVVPLPEGIELLDPAGQLPYPLELFIVLFLERLENRLEVIVLLLCKYHM